jgi:hypothetical protein
VRGRLALLMFAVALSSGTAHALEGGTGAYLLGSRDSFAGIVPGPGTYVTNNSVFMNAKGPTLAISGIAVVEPEVDLYINKLDIAHFFGGQILGGTPGIVFTVPYAAGDLSGDLTAGGFAGGFKDKDGGFSDPIITPVIGWHSGKLHYSASLSIFVPVGEYDDATVSLAPPSVDNVLNFGKNRWAFVPALSATYFDPATGVELSGSAGITFSTKNEATDWQTAPELNLEAAALQHLPNGVALGVSGYAYQQLGEDSGDGADNFKDLTDAESLEARVFGIGPIATYSTKISGAPFNFKLKYIHEFEARRRFEGDIFWGSINFSF